MKIAIGCDHGGFEAKEIVKKELEREGIDVIDCGTNSTDSCDYPVFAFSAAEKVASGEAEKGILICSSGEGVSICANKVKGIRCGIGYNDTVTELSVQHNHANMIAFGAKYMEKKDILNRSHIFLNAKPSQEERHCRRVSEIDNYDNQR